MNSQMSHEAAGWFVLHDSAQTDVETAQTWEEWCTNPDHRTEYVGVMQLVLDLSEIPPPPPVSRRDLLEDVAAGEGARN